MTTIERVAGAGYLALSPNLYSRGGRARCITRVFRETLEGACPLVASFGAKDPTGIGAADRLRRAVEDKDIPHDIKVYPGVGHSFANRLPAQPLLRVAGFGYNEAATADAWARVFAFFGEHLRAGG